MYFLGIDASLNHTGLCRMRAGLQNVVATTLAPNGLLGADRLKFNADKLNEFLDQMAGEQILAAVEGYAFSRDQTRAFSVGEWGGVVRYILTLWGVPFVVVNPAHLKMWLTGKGRADKLVVQDEVERQFQVRYLGDDNQADAFVLSAIAMDVFGCWEGPVTEARLHVSKMIQEDPHGIYSKQLKAKIAEANGVDPTRAPRSRKSRKFV